jgi:hypothetical protein
MRNMVQKNQIVYMALEEVIQQKDQIIYIAQEDVVHVGNTIEKESSSISLEWYVRL